uniref:Sialic acid-binding Ig-like lectin 13 n=1 Tax=Phascolarctos cinereus TaxID=38626 RepID=A0A6P5LQR3_PHACI|nr:sialic acid-binding Ig-like lectin 13 [Phascolarctos cinereus]
MGLLMLLLPLLWRETISQNPEYGIHVQETVTVQEGLCVSIPCSFYYPQQYKNKNTVHGYWYYNSFWKSSLAATNDPQESVHSWAPRPIPPHWRSPDGQLFPAYYYSPEEYLTQKPEVHIPGILKSGHQSGLELPLSSNRFASQDLHSSQLLFTPQPQDHGTSLTCQVTFKNPSVTTKTTVQLRVSYPPWNMEIISWANGTGPVFLGNTSSLVVLEGESLTLDCYTHSEPQATLSWAHGNQILHSTQALNPEVLRLELSKLGIEGSGEYTCQACNSLGHHNHSVRLCVQTVTQKPEMHIPEILESGRQVTLTCLVPGACREGKHFTYFWTGTALSSQGSALLNTSRLLFTPQSQHHGTNITCKVTFPKARVSTQRTVQLRVTYPPQNVTISVSWPNKTGPELLGNTSSLQVLEGESLTLVCATESNPPATLTWTYRNTVLQSSKASDPGVLHLELSKLGPKDRGEYTCHAQHRSGPQQHSIRLCVQSCSCCPIFEENGSWPLIFTLLRGALMGVSFLLTYGLTWLYYTCQVNQPLDTLDKSEMDLHLVPVFCGI